MHIYDARPNAMQRQLEDMGQRVSTKGRALNNGATALSKGLADSQRDWLLNYCIDRFTSLHGSLATWRGKLEKFERMAEDDYTDRQVEKPDQDRTDALKSIFTKQNDSLGVVSGFADFLHAQARDDIFGTRPWLAAVPVGPSDSNLAERMTKHCQWKFDQSNLEETLIDTIRSAIDLGTQFVKIGWLRDVETIETAIFAAHNSKTGQAILSEAGDYIRDVETLAPVLEKSGIDGADVEWRELLIENTTTTYNNAVASNLDFKDVAFDNKAPQLDLQYTDFFSRFRMGLLDAASFYHLSPEDTGVLRASLANDTSHARDHRDEVPAQITDYQTNGLDANPQILLVDGYVRVDPFGAGKPKRLQVVFAPELRVLLFCDYLANVTPDGRLPVFPVRCFKIPKRITGRGYFEKYEKTDTAIDHHYNTTVYPNRSQVISSTNSNPE